MKRKKQQGLQLEKERVQKLQELGATLRQLRQEQSLSLEEVAARTHIQRRLLQAIEEGRLDQLPEPVYVHGFIKKYAAVVGLNGVEFADTFPMGPQLKSTKGAWRKLPAAQLRPLHLYLLYVLVIISSVNSLSYVLNRSATSNAVNLDPIAPTEGSPDSRNPKFGPIVPSFPVGSNKAKINKLPSSQDAIANILPLLRADSGKSVRVSVTLESQSWLLVVADGKTEFEGVLPEGTQRNWAATKKLTLRAGNAGGVLVAVNEGQVKKMGQPGSVEEVTFEANPTSAQLPQAIAKNNALRLH